MTQFELQIQLETMKTGHVWYRGRDDAIEDANAVMHDSTTHLRRKHGGWWPSIDSGLRYQGHKSQW